MTAFRIALLFEFPTLNGGERSMLAALDWLLANDASFDFVVIGPFAGRLADAFRDRGISIAHWSPTDADGTRRPVDEIDSSLCQVIERLRPQLVHANSLSMGRITGRLSSQMKIPTTAHLRDIIRLSASAIADLNRNDHLIAVSDATRDFHAYQGLDERRMTVVYNGVDLERFRPRPSSGRLMSELRSPKSDDRVRRIIATIGQIGIRKGQDVLAKTARLIVDRVPEVCFVLIGERTSQKDESVQFEQSIHRDFANFGLSDRLHCLGYRDDVHELLNEIDLLVHPANQEPFGRVLLEASASGVPIVATNVGGTCEIIVDGITGRIVPPRNAEQLAIASISILENEAEAQRLRVAARERAVKEFSISVAAQKLASVWARVLSNRHI